MADDTNAQRTSSIQQPLNIENAYHSLPERAEGMVLNHQNFSFNTHRSISDEVMLMGEEPCGTQSTLLDIFPSM